MKQITEIHWKIKVGKKYYGDFVTLSMPLNPKYSIESTLKEIRLIIEETTEILIEQAVDSIQTIITGKTEADVMREEVERGFDKKGQKRNN